MLLGANRSGGSPCSSGTGKVRRSNPHVLVRFGLRLWSPMPMNPYVLIRFGSRGGGESLVAGEVSSSTESWRGSNPHILVRFGMRLWCPRSMNPFVLVRFSLRGGSGSHPLGTPPDPGTIGKGGGRGRGKLIGSQIIVFLFVLLPTLLLQSCTSLHRGTPRTRMPRGSASIANRTPSGPRDPSRSSTPMARVPRGSASIASRSPSRSGNPSRLSMPRA